MALLLASLIGIAVGLIMGLTGAGGGMLAVPALVYSQGWTMQEAMPVALLAVSLGALIGAIDGLRRRQVRYKAATLMALVGAPMTSLGVWVAKDLSQKTLMAAFAVVLLIVVIRLVRQALRAADDAINPSAIALVNASTGRFDWNIKTATVISVIGSCAGFATGMLGVGGGFIIVPLLRHFTNLSMQSAAATSLMVISLVGSVAVGSALLHGAQIPILFSALFATMSVVGVLAGRRIANFLPSRIVQMIFASLLATVAVSFIWKVLN
ncbi:sulfite exporter TauE/SafE family protein [Undibacterium cyanobacteriorum]|uniref:Probable membrane transporter protein n=1 Tax=Undibacterium cyanobacteriorum TaxID=3073561 RepID=A0ABY9RF39_9BURK|nr:sulfite exporter TauE/SafE family protein [Undibacterium sp. 20NA77.5]WMW79838.1 sulfite exporter TauE/SafE family protein [Undibacterium sp. 20NA77.5]